ncbi:MAG: DrmB family protein [Bacillota bacterium]
MRARWEDPRLRKEVLRRAQAIVPFGVGSILDLPEESVMCVSTDFWEDSLTRPISEPRLQKRLRVSGFRVVKSAEENPDVGVPFTHFPKWLFCPKCRRFRPVQDWAHSYRQARGRGFQVPMCDVCDEVLVPSRFIVVCENGHIDDFPWVQWAHHRANVCENPVLELRTVGSRSGLEGIQVRCVSCDAPPRNMVGAFSEDLHSHCSGNMPWIFEQEPCDKKPRTVQRGASNVYFPRLATSIAIPPYVDRLSAEIQGTAGWEILSTQEGALDGPHAEFLVKEIAKSLNRDIDEVRETLRKMLGDSAPLGPDDTSESQYRVDEYKAFRGAATLDADELADFHTEIRDPSEYRIPGVKGVTLVHRLREVRALTGFSRIYPIDREEPFIDDPGTPRGREVPLGRKRLGWLPATEVRGEGIFLEFDIPKLDAWAEETSVGKRALILENNYNKMAEQRELLRRRISPQFVCLHTLAHLLIRQLSFECGYGSASLRERIYCSELGGWRMAGILIYTASGDSEGTLGGLVRQGRPEFLTQLFARAVVEATWCSSDPLCIESEGQGLGDQNLAACHACCLLPETSCEEFNRLLDRGLVVGLPDRPDLGFFSELVRG